MAHSEDERKALGKRLSASRNLAGLTIDGAAKKLTEIGYPLTKQALGHWETGRNVPDAIWLRRLAKLYNTTMDALSWDDSLTIEAMQIAAEFDSLTEKQKSAFKLMWLGYATRAVTDAEVADRMPVVNEKKAGTRSTKEHH